MKIKSNILDMKQFNHKLLLSVFMLLLFSFNLKAQIEDFKVGTTTRKMLVYAPSGIVPNRPLLISLHGMNQDIAYQQNQTKWELVAKENNFVVVYPGGINNSWDLSGNSDINFILAIIDEMSKRYSIDRDRVYLSGFSMGSMMTYYAATKIADKIAAFAPVSGYLMQGPNTNSSRPIPIIHTHGTTDDVVAYSGVQRCLDAWITRNKCLKTAVVTQPYPVGKNSSNGTKYYWGPGTDSVEIVLLSLKGVGHWHSNDPNGVHTSQEIWNFCKKFSLGYGVPKFKYASVGSLDPKQIKVEFTLPVKKSSNIEGFAVKVDGMFAEIDSVVFVDSLHLAINLADSILNINEISVSYSNGNVVSVFDKKLTGFDSKLVENLLAGASPRIVEIAVTEDGKVLLAKFNKIMLRPSDISTLVLTAQFNGDFNIPITEYSFLNSDSTTFAFALGEQVFADYNLLFTYSGNNLVAADSSAVKNFADFQVTNKSTGLPVRIVSGALETNAFNIALEFSKPMAMSDSQLGQFAFDVNGKTVTVRETFVLKNTIRFVLSNNLYYGDSIKVTYTPGNITATDKGQLESFSNYIIENPIQEPTWHTIPGIVEAEDFALQFGTDTELTGDTGGGKNVGWTEAGDWLVYAIDNNSDKEEYQISFRVAAQSNGALFSYFIDNVKAGQVTVPSTTGWQIWKSVVKKITLPKGKHYFKIVVVAGGFNINFFEIQSDFVGINEINFEDLKIYQDIASNNVIIKSNGFQYNKIEIFNALGKVELSQKIVSEPVLNLPVNLESGFYTFRLSNEKEYQVKKVPVIRH
jgi:poly(3-hydroxybutyrate) depolymerase